MIEDLPIFRAKVTTTVDFRQVKSLNTNTRIRTKDREIEATIEDVHEVLMVDY